MYLEKYGLGKVRHVNVQFSCSEKVEIENKDTSHLSYSSVQSLLKSLWHVPKGELQRFTLDINKSLQLF